MLQRRDLAIEPQMDAGNRRRREVMRALPEIVHLGSLRQDFVDAVEGSSEHGVVGPDLVAANAEMYGVPIGMDRIDRGAKMHLAATLLDVGAGGPIEFRERHG